MPYGQFLDGQTIDQLQAAGAARISVVLITGQGGSTMLAQPLSAIWSWIAGHLPQWKRPVVEITSTTQLDASVHTNAILVVSQPTTINPAFTTQGSGFTCTIINASAGAVTLGPGFVTNTGTSSIPVGQMGQVFAASYSGGSLNYTLTLREPEKIACHSGMRRFCSLDDPPSLPGPGVPTRSD